MSKPFSGLLAQGQRLVQRVALALVVIVAAFLAGISLAAATGVLPWLQISTSWNGAPVEQAGMIAQLGVTALFVGLVFFLPANGRMLRLENSHRDFQVKMDDVARAYRAAHEDDRRKLFKIGSEFDDVRQRLAHLRDHPDLGALEPEVLELAAQMSFEARDLATIYSDEKVERARAFLRQRQEEVEAFQENLALARQSVGDLRHWLLQVETEEGLVAGQIDALEKDLFDLLPQLGFELGFEERPARDQTVVPMASPKTAKNPSKSEVH